MPTLKNIPTAGYTVGTPKLHGFTRRTFRPRLVGWNANYWNKHPLEFGWQVSQYFVDKPAVNRAIERSIKRPLVRAGAYIRRAARQSMKRRKRPSTPGMPPHWHSPEPNLRTVWFAWDPFKDTVVVGPVLFRRAKDGGGHVPPLHEKGGVKIIRRKAYWFGGSRFKKQKIPIRYPKRPFMVPALRREAPKFPGLWENSVKP